MVVGFGVEVAGLWVQGLRAESLEFEAKGLACRVWDLGLGSDVRSSSNFRPSSSCD